MTSMVETVARAICCPNGCHIVRINERAETAREYPQPWPCCWRQCEDKARAALQALREPSEGFTERFAEAFFNSLIVNSDDHPWSAASEECRTSWREKCSTALDAALSETE